MLCRKFSPISLPVAVPSKLPQIYEPTTFHVKMGVCNGILHPCVTFFGTKNILEIPNGRNITPRILSRSIAKSILEKFNTTGQRERIRQLFQSWNTSWCKNCWKANRNESLKGITKYIRCARSYIADRVIPYFAERKSMQLFTGYA